MLVEGLGGNGSTAASGPARTSVGCGFCRSRGAGEDRTFGSDAMGSIARRCEFVEFPLFVSVEGRAPECHFGQDQADHLNGGGGRDSLFGGPGADRVQGFGGRDRVNGDAGDDILTGNESAHRLRGETGDDRVIGGAGGDDLEGGPGVDRCQGGTGIDDFSGCEFA